MRIIAFMPEPNSLKAIMQSVRLPHYRAPPPLSFKLRSTFMEQLCLDDIPADAEHLQRDDES